MIVRPGTRVLLAITATALTAGGLAACSSSKAAETKSTSSAAAQSSKETTLRFVASDEDGNMVTEDLGAKSADGGPDIGDLLAFTQTLSVDGKDVGHVHVAAVGVDHAQHLSQINGTLVLADGDIEVGGIVPQDPAFTLVITGGTGAYVSAAGTMDFALDGDSQTLTAHLVKH
ncbi:MAG: allene oxide cyclase barrel-like domain-containing protein [Acidothermaceae bacterium]